MKRRTVLGLGAGALAVGGVGVGGMILASPYMPPRALPRGTMTSGVDVDLAFGAYRVHVASGRFEVLHNRKVIWAASPFMIAAKGRITWRDRKGHLSADRRLTAVLDSLHVTGATASESRVTINATLRGDDAELPANLILSADEFGLVIEGHVPGADLIALRMQLGEKEGVHGAGEQFTSFDLRGNSYLLVTREQGVGRGEQPLTILAEATNGAGGSLTTTYAPLPFVITDAMRSLAWTSDAPGELDLRNRDLLDLSIWAQQVNARLEDAADPPTLLRTHTRLSGRMGTLPDWTGRGAILGLQGGTQQVRDKLDRVLRQDGEVAGVWLQDWVGWRTTDFGSRLWWTWELDQTRYPQWDRLVEDLAAKQIKVLSYVNPFLVDPTGKPGGVRRNLFAEARDLGHLVRNRSGAPYLLDQGGFEAALVDLSKPEAVTWFGEVIRSQVAAAGAGGWMADFAEGLPFDAVLAGGSPAEWHNRWPTAWAELNAAVRRDLPDDPLVFHRSAGRGSPAAAGAFWAGDQLVDWSRTDGMYSALLGMLSGGVSGMTLNHTDVGGYTTLTQPIIGVQRSADLLLRWAEWSAWTPLLRTHEGNLPDSNVQAYDDVVVRGFAAQTRIFAALAPYRAEVVAQAASEGMPALRHCWVHYPGTAAAKLDDQYFYGDRFLVGPVFSPAVRARQITLPPGNWTHIWSGASYAGDQRIPLPCPPGQPIVLHRADDGLAATIAEWVKRAAL